MTPADLYRTCRYSVYRLETLQHYAPAGPDDEGRRREFAARGVVLPPGPGKRDDLRLIADLVQSGRKAGRVHVVSWPLSDYIRYELAVYPENAAAGEDIRIGDIRHRPLLGALYCDFVMADGERVILFDYDEDGHLLGYEYRDDAETVARCRRDYRMALAYSVPLSDFTAAIAA